MDSMSKNEPFSWSAFSECHIMLNRNDLREGGGLRTPSKFWLHRTHVPSRHTRRPPPPTWELNGEARLADEEVTVELQGERAEGAVGVLREHGAAPLLEQDVAVHRPVPHLQDVVGRLRVEHDEVQAAGESTACTSLRRGLPAPPQHPEHKCGRAKLHASVCPPKPHPVLPGATPPRGRRQSSLRAPHTLVQIRITSACAGYRACQALCRAMYSRTKTIPFETARSFYNSKLPQATKSKVSLKSLCFKRIKVRFLCGVPVVLEMSH